MSHPRPFSHALNAMAAMAVVLVTLASHAEAVVVQTTYRKLDGGEADFGSGSHSAGVPQGDGVVTFDYAAGAQLVATGRVRGTLYWDSLTDNGCVRFIVRFRRSDLSNLAVRSIDLCGPGGDANNAANQAAVDETFASSELAVIHISTNEVIRGEVVPRASTSITSPRDRTYTTIINSGTADFGSLTHQGGTPLAVAYLSFVRGDGVPGSFAQGGFMGASVSGVLYWDSLFDTGCARIISEFRRLAGDAFTVLSRRQRDKCGPGGDANNSANKLDILERFSNGTGEVGQIGVEVGTVARNGSFVNVTRKTFNFNGEVGNFELDPSEATVAVHEPLLYAITWSVPEGLTWHDLQSLELKVLDDQATLLWLRFDEETESFSVFDESKGRFGPAFAAGSQKRLKTHHAWLNLAETTIVPVNSVLGSGATSPAVTLNLPLSFKPSVAKEGPRGLRVEVAATDDFGNEDPFVHAGTLVVDP